MWVGGTLRLWFVRTKTQYNYDQPMALNHNIEPMIPLSGVSLNAVFLHVKQSAISPEMSLSK